MKKISILTFQRPINYGASLQAVATCRYLMEQGYDSRLVDYRHSRIEKNRKIIGGRWSRKKSLIGNIKSLIKDILDYKKEISRNIKHDDFVNRNTKLTKPCNDTNISEIVIDSDVIFVGSDLVWNWELDTNLNSVFFLDFAKNFLCKKVSYASSIGSSIIPENLRSAYKEKLETFDAISVRELSTKFALEELLNRKVECVVDPTLQMDSEQWEKLEKPYDTPQKYILLYLLESNAEIDLIVNKAVQYFNLPIFYYSKKNHHYLARDNVNYYKAGPDEFLYLIHHASFVITNSFHGTAFSVIFDRPFVSIPHTTRGNRMKDFLGKIKLSEHCVSSVENLDLSKCNRQMTRENKIILRSWIKSSREYLQNNI